MAYLKKDKRYDDILNTAMQIMVEDGMSAITVRRVAKDANIAVGQIHHHFKSIGQLKAQALIKITEQLVTKVEQNHSNQQHIIDKIITAVSPIGGEEGLVIRKLWSEATFLAERDPDINLACKQSTDEWHKTIMKLLLEAVASKELPETDVSELAWRLIALSCGMDSLCVVDEQPFSKIEMRKHLAALLHGNNN